MRSKGIYINPERIQEINELKDLVDRKGFQSFFGNINFVCRFILGYASIVKPITKLLRKDQSFNGPLKYKENLQTSKL